MINFGLFLFVFFGSIHGSVVQKRSTLLSNVASEISNGSNKTLYSALELKNMFEKIGFKNCSSQEEIKDCQKCLGVSDLLQWNGYPQNVSLNSTELKKLYPSVLYFLTPIPNFSAVCNKSVAKSRKNLTASRPAFNALLNQYGGQTKLEEKHINSMLEDINKTISYRLTKKPCFDVEEALSGSGVPESGADKDGFQYLGGYVVLQLMKGHCIAEHHHHHTHKPSGLPAAKVFIEDLFKEYGKNGTISEEKFEALLKKLAIGGTASTTTTTDPHAGHDHRKRRSIDQNEDDDGGKHHRQRRSAAGSSIAGKCYTADNLMTIHSINHKTGINQAQFQSMCPSLIQQVESGSCKTKTATEKGKEHGWKPWVSSIVAVMVISFGSLIGILVAPFSEGKNFSTLLTFMIAIGVSTLLGDSVLHLLPHSMNLHKHDEGSAHVSTTAKESFIWKSLLFITGVYVFYLFESIMHATSKQQVTDGLEETHQHVGKGRTHSVVTGPADIIRDHNKDSENPDVLMYCETKELLKAADHCGPYDHDKANQDGLVRSASGMHRCEETACIKMEELNKKDKGSEVYTNPKAYENGNSKGNALATNGHSHNGNSLGHSHGGKKSPLKSVAWMVLIGDSIHNFLDGIAIGVAFTDKFPLGFYGGISTSVAILCHELPHELGDFAILIQSGLSIKLALFLNFMTSLTAVLGALIGVSLGQAFDAGSWIFAITAGLFVYISLVDMLPELIHSADLRISPLKTMFFQNVGLWLGFGVMLCLAIFEENIKV